MREEGTVTPEERRYLDAARPFALAVAARQYEQAYDYLSSHARARMSLNQFVPSTDDAAAARNEQMPITTVTPGQFAELMKKVEQAHGAPRALISLSVFSTDPDVLGRRRADGLGALDSMFAIGAMPDSIPPEIRRASVRGQIQTRLSPEQLAQAAQEMETTPAELEQDPDFAPYFNVKIVLIEEDGHLEVGYFEFLPPSMLD